MHSDIDIALTGLKHSGKTTLARRLSKRLAYAFHDLDHEMVFAAERDGWFRRSSHTEEAHNPIRTLYRTAGRDRFQSWEAAVLQRIVEMRTTEDGTTRPVLLATGGGICDNREAMGILVEHYHVLYLRNDPLVLYERIAARGIPAFLDPSRPRDHFLEIAARRDTLYRRSARDVIDLTGLGPDEAFRELLNRLG